MLKWLLFLIIIFIGLYYALHNNQPIDTAITEQTIEEIPEDTHIQDIISKVNDKNNKIHSMSSQAIVSTDGVNVDAQVYYVKDNKFRMLFSNILDIGCNDEIFWFWSKQYDRQTVYYAKHGEKTRLKTPFKPVWIMESLGLNEVILTDDMRYKEDGGYLKLYKPYENVWKAILIKDNKITGTYLYDLDGKCLIESKWSENTLVINWYEENKVMKIRFINMKFNGDIGDFKMPVRKKIVDMGKS